MKTTERNRFWTLIISMLCFMHGVFGQAPNQDSLIHDFWALEDTSAIQKALEISSDPRYAQSDTALYFAKEALRRSKDLGYITGEVEGHIEISKYYLGQKNRSVSREHVDAALAQARQSRDKYLIYRGLRYVAWHHFVFEDFPTSLSYYLDMIDHCEEIDLYECLTAAMMNAGTIYTSMDSHGERNNYSEANRLFQQLITKAEERKDSMVLLQALVNLSANYRQAGQQDSSIIHSQKAFDIAQAMGSEIGIVKSSSLLAMNHLDGGRFEAAQRHADLIINSKTKNLQSLGLAYKYKAAAADSLGRVQEAFRFAQESLELNIELNSGMYLMNSYEQLYLLNKKYNNPQLALTYFERHEHLKDSIFNLENNVRVSELKEQFENDKNQLKIAALERENTYQSLQQQRKNILYIILLLGSVLAGVSIYFFSRNRLLRQEQETSIIKQRLFRAQINPHFIFNSLNSIQHLIYNKRDPDIANSYLSKFSSLMRNTLESSIDEYIDLEDELESIRNYLDLQKLRFPDKFDFVIKVEDNLEIDRIQVPAMLSQPFLENAVLHAFPNNFEGLGNIEIRFSAQSHVLELVIYDNGVGISQTNGKSHSGYRSRAIQITRDRLELLRIKNKEAVDLQIKDLSAEGKSGTSIYIHLPLILN